MTTTHDPDFNQTDDHPSSTPLSEEATHECSDTAGDEHGRDQTGNFTDEELNGILESLLFVSPDPVTVERLGTALRISKSEVRGGLSRLQADWDRARRGLLVVEVAGGFQLVTRPEYAPWIKQLGKSKPAPKLSRSALESLAIIAYKQPIVRAEIEHIRGVETSGVLRTLLERKLVRMVGRKDVPGRPIMYGTTKYFLEHFGLRDLTELPPLREFKELGEREQALLPIGEDPLAVGSVDPTGEDALSFSASGSGSEE